MVASSVYGVMVCRWDTSYLCLELPTGACFFQERLHPALVAPTEAAATHVTMSVDSPHTRQTGCSALAPKQETLSHMG